MVAQGWRSLPVVFDGSMDQKFERKLAPHGVLERVVNMRKDKDGRLVKRLGFTTMGSTKFLTGDTAPSAPLRVATLGNELVRIDSENVQSYLETQSDEYTMRARGNVCQLKERAGFLRTGNSSLTQANVDFAVSNGYAVFAHRIGGDVYARVIETATGAIVHNEAQISTGGDTCTRITVVAGTNSIVVFWGVAASTKIVYRILTTTDAGINSGFAAETPLVTNTAATPYYDVARTGTTGTPRWALLYWKTGNLLRLHIFSDAFSSVAADEASLSGVQDVSVYGELDMTHIWCMACDSTNGVRMTVYDQTPTVVTGPTALDATSTTCLASGIAKIGGASVAVIWQRNASVSLNWTGVMQGHVMTTSGTSGSLRTWQGAQMIARPFGHGSSQISVPVRLAVVSNNAGAVLQLTSRVGALMAQPMPLVYFARELNVKHMTVATIGCPHSLNTATNEYAFPFCFDLTLGASGIGGDLLTLNMAGLTSQLFTEHAEALYGSGSLVMEYDGQKYAELGFLFPPSLTATEATPSASGGSIGQGVYQYSFVEEWFDRKGRRHQGPPSAAVSVDMSTSAYVAGTNSVAWNVPPSRYTRKQDPDDATNKSYIVMYRTKAGPGSIFYRVKIVAENDPTTGSAFSTTDSSSDTTISANETLYTSSSERNHEIAPASHFVTSHDQRLCGIDSEYRTRIWLTNQTRQGEGPEYCGANEIFVEGYGNLVALGSMDGKLYALTSSAILVATWGDGPDATGGGQPFQQPQLLSKEAGCSDPRSVIVGPDGLYFAGEGVNGTGLYLWRRGDAGLVYVGDKVRDELTTYPTITSAVHVQGENQLWFTAWDGSTSGVMLVYDYSHKDIEGIGSWSVYRFSNGSGGYAPFVSATYWKGVWVGGRADGNLPLWKQTTSYLDNDSAHIDCEILTGHIWPAGLNVPCRVKSVTPLLEFQADSRIVLTGYDNTGATESRTINVATGTADLELLLKWQPRTQKRTKGNVRYLIQQTQNSTANSEGVAMHGLSLEFIPLSTGARLKAAHRG